MRIARCGFDDSGEVFGRDLLVQFGPTLLVDIGFEPGHDPARAGHGDLDLPLKAVHALVDTGATTSCIDSAAAAQLNLPIIDRRPIAGVGGIKEVNMHLAQIRIPTLQINIYGSFAAVDLTAGGQPHYALIGRSFLQHFSMFYEGNTGRVTIAEPGGLSCTINSGSRDPTV